MSFPHLESAVGAVELDDLNFHCTSFPPGKLSARRDGDYIVLDLWTGLSVCARSVTGSLLFRYPHGLICRCFGATIVPQDRHCRTTVVRNTPGTCYSRRTRRIEGYLFRSSVIVILIIWYYFGVFRVRDMASDGLPDSEQASYAPSGPLPGTFLGPALDIRSERLYDLAPDIPDVMGLRAFRPNAAVVKPESSSRFTADMSSVQVLMDLALPRFAMAEGSRQVHPPWPVAS